VPTSVLLAVLAAAGLLALAPALVRRHDATERQVAERARSTARVLPRSRRRRSVPGRRPVNPSRVLVPTLRTAAPVSRRRAPEAEDQGQRRRDGGRADPAQDRRVREPDRLARQRALAVVPRSAPPAQRRPPGRPSSPAIYRRRRVLAALVVLNLVKLVGVVAVGPGFWVGFAVTGTLLLAYLVHLRNFALADQRRRRIEARRAAVVAAQQAEVRREQDRRTAARRETARRMAEQRESLRRAGAAWSAPPNVSYRPAAPAPQRRFNAG
jgi:hypothetical protein